MEHLEQAFLINKAMRYDIKGRKYINTPCKYYFEDVGLRNARLNFRQLEENHIMENIIYNELRIRGFNVDVGVVEVRGRADSHFTRKQFEEITLWLPPLTEQYRIVQYLQQVFEKLDSIVENL